MIAPDETTFTYLEGRQFAPKGNAFVEAVEYWKTLSTDQGAVFDRELELDISSLPPQVSWGTNPAMVADITGEVPDPQSFPDENSRRAAARALEYMALRSGLPIQEINVDRVFIGSC